MLIFAKEDCMSDSMETPRKPVLTAKEKEKAEKYSKRMELTLNLANLGCILQNTFTAGNRVLDILDEQPVTKDVTGCESIEFKGAAAENVTFSYGEKNIKVYCVENGRVKG